MRMRLAAFLMLISGLLWSSAASADLKLTETDIEWNAIAPHVTARADASQIATLSDMQDDPDGFAPLTGTTADFGYTHDVIWLRFGVQNATGNTDWRLRFRENFFPKFEVYMVDDAGGVTTLEHQTPTSVFASRRVGYPELIAAFQLDPGQAATIFVRYQSGGSSELSFSVMSSQEFTTFAARKTAKNFIYYGMMMLLIGAALVAWIATRGPVFAAYAAYAAFGLLFIAHADGNAFLYLWPNAPVFNAFATVLLGSGLIVFGAQFARVFLQTGLYHPVLNKVLLALIAVTIAIVLSTVVFDTQIIKHLLVLISLVAALLFTLSGLVAARTRFREVRFYVLAWFGAVVSSVIMTMRHWIGLEISEELQFDSMRVVFVMDAALMGLAILDRINQLRQNRQEALELSLSEAQKTVRLSARLSDLEKKFRMAEELSQLRDRSLANTVHDLRQPLHALRLNVQNVVSQSQANPELGDIEDMFVYLENLIRQELDQHSGHSSGELPRDAAGAAMVDLNDIIHAVCEMFGPDAAAKGVDLRQVPTSAKSDLPPLVLMRMLSNLVSNAVKYTDQGKILIGLRHRDGALRLEVHDTGRGLPEGQFEKAQQHMTRLDDVAGVEGHGLGLSYVRDMARAHDVRITLLPRINGTSITLTLPKT